MNRFVKSIVNTAQGLIKAVARFPLTVACLLGATMVTCYMISLHATPSLFIQKLLYTFGLGSFLSIAAQFIWERFRGFKSWRLLVYAGAALLIFGYYLTIASVPGIYYAVRARTIVAAFAMLCITIWVPSFRNKREDRAVADFNVVALIHFKAIITSILFSAVLTGGITSILAAVDFLLFKINRDSYGYTIAIIWITFATIYYLSRLPLFHSKGEEDISFMAQMAVYPKVLKILISYIVIPLIAAYSLVLISYFVKIIVTFKWPANQLGPMILTYSSVGLFVYVLASILEDRFAKAYRLIFPKVLIIMVIMQLVSAYLRLNAYGFTEGRYYLILFGVYSLVCGIVLSIHPMRKIAIIALLGAVLATLSVIPPVDAFTVSRNSQKNRLERMLSAEGVLVDGKVISKPDASQVLRQETTNILNYMERRNYLQDLDWLPEDMKEESTKSYENLSKEKMKALFGFEPAYEAVSPNAEFFYAGIDMRKPFSISGYDVMVSIGTYRSMAPEEKLNNRVNVMKDAYTVTVERLTSYDARVSVRDVSGTEVIGTNLYDFAKTLTKSGSEPKEMLSPDAMSISLERDGYKLKVLFQMVNMNLPKGGGDEDAGADYDLYILFGAP